MGGLCPLWGIAINNDINCAVSHTLRAVPSIVVHSGSPGLIVYHTFYVTNIAGGVKSRSEAPGGPLPEITKASLISWRFMDTHLDQ